MTEKTWQPFEVKRTDGETNRGWWQRIGDVVHVVTMPDGRDPNTMSEDVAALFGGSPTPLGLGRYRLD